MEISQQELKIPETVYRNRYVILAIVLMGTLMSVMDSNVVNIALPTMMRHFNISVADAQWIVTGYLMTLTATLLIFGKISEYVGRTSMFMLGIAVFTLSSFACGMSTGLGELAAFRIVQALGAAMVFSISQSITVEVFPKGERGRALGLNAATVGLSMIFEPPLGGFIVDALGWNYIFFINVPIGVVLLAAAWRYMRIDEQKSDRLEMDWTGAALLVVLVVSLILFLNELAKNAGFGTLQAAYGMVFLGSTALFAWQELHCERPLLDLSVLRVRQFALPTLCMVLLFIAIGMFTFALPFYFQGVFGWKPTQVGMIMMIVAVAMIIVSPMGGWAHDRFRFRFLPSVGMAVIGISSLAFAHLLSGQDLFWLAVALAVTGIGYGIFMSPNNATIMSSLPRRPSMLSSMVATFRNLGAVLGASFASLFLSVRLGTAGSDGAILQAGTSLLTNAVGDTIYAAGVLCLIAALIGLFRE